MTTCPRLYPNAIVVAYIATLPLKQRNRLPAVVPYSWSLEKVRRIAWRDAGVIAVGKAA